MSESINNTKLIESLQSQITFLQQTIVELRQRVQRLENNTKVPNPFPQPLFPFPGPQLLNKDFKKTFKNSFKDI
jgi:hypothetical protein